MALFLSLNNKRTTLFGKRVSIWAFTLLLLFLFSLLLLTYSCSNKQVNSDITVIDFVSGLNNPRIVDLNEIATDIEYIPLETTDGALIGKYPTISIGNNRIYVVSDRKMVKIFDAKGNYLFTFNKRGRGPQEYLYNQDFIFDKENGNIIVNVIVAGSSTLMPKVITYDSLGRYLYSEPRAMVDSLYLLEHQIKINDTLYLGAVPVITSKKPDFWIAAFQKDGHIIKKFPTPPITQQQQNYLPTQITTINKDGAVPKNIYNLSPYLYSVGNYTRVFSKLLDTLYLIDSNLHCKPQFIIDYRNIMADGTTPEGAKRGEGKYVRFQEREYKEWKDYILFNYDLNEYAFEPYETSLNVSSRVINLKHTDAYALFNKESAEFTFMRIPFKDKPGFRDNLKGGPPFIPQFITQDGSYAVSLLSAEEALEHAQTGQMKGEFAKIASKTDKMDNHFVVLVKLK